MSEQQRYMLFHATSGATLRMDTSTGKTWVLGTRDTLHGAKARWIEVDDPQLPGEDTPLSGGQTAPPGPAGAA